MEITGDWRQNIWLFAGEPERGPFTTQLVQYLVDEADSWGLAAIQEVNIYDLQLLQSDVEGLELAVVPVQRDHFEQTIIQSQADHAAFWVHYSNYARFWWTPNTILQKILWFGEV